MESDVYTVPTEVLFRNYATASGPQTRNLLIKNNTKQSLQTIISYPFSPNFRLHAPADQRAELKPTPPHLLLDLPPNSTSKVVVELKPPDATQPGSSSSGPQHLQDVLVVVFGGLRSLLVPLRAVHHGVDSAAATAGGTALSGFAFWPPQEELDTRCTGFTQQVQSQYGIQVAPPATASVAAFTSTSISGIVPGGMTVASSAPQPPVVTQSGGNSSRVASGRGSGSGGDGIAGAAPLTVSVEETGGTAAGAPSADTGLVPSSSSASRAETPPRPSSQQQQQPLMQPSSRPPPKPPAAELPPEGFSRHQYDTNGDLLYGNDSDAGDCDDGNDPQQPYVLHKTIKVQGRVAVAVSSPPSASAASAAALTSQPSGDPLRCTSSSGAAAATAAATFSSRPVSGQSSAAEGAGMGLMAGTTTRLAFALNGRLYDARGIPLEPSLERLTEAGLVTVVDCGDGPLPPRTSGSGNPGSRTSNPGETPNPFSRPPPAVGSPSLESASASGPGSGFGAVPLMGVGGRGPSLLAPLRHGGVPVTASLRPGSASAAAGSPLAAVAAAMSPLVGRPPPPPPLAVGGGTGGGGGEDPLRQAALAAAMRELGITDLPAPSPSGVSRGSAAAPPMVPAGALAGRSSYVQYGLPPNYRPSSGTRRPSATGGGGGGSGVATNATAYDSTSYDYDDAEGHDDGDLEARLQQQVESNVLRTTGGSPGPGPAPMPRRTPPAGRVGGGGVAPASSPGSYLPPRAGAASTGGLGAPSAAAAAAAAVATGSRLGKAAAAAAARAGGSSGIGSGYGSVPQRETPDNGNDYPEETEFEMRLQRQIDSDFASGGGAGGGGGVGGGGGGARGGGGGAGWRGGGASGARGTGTSAAAATGAKTTGTATSGTSALKRTSSASGIGGPGGGGGGAASGGAAAAARRVSADSGAAGKKAVAASSQPKGGSGGGGAGGGSSGTRQSRPAAWASGNGPPPPPGSGARAVSTTKPNGAGTAPATGPAAQRLKANWDALG